MKKIWLFVLCISLVLQACTSNEPGISKIEEIPDDLSRHMSSNYRLQLIVKGEQNYFVVFRSNGDVTMELGESGDAAVIEIMETNLNEEEMSTPHVFELKTKVDHFGVEATINGESVPFDNVAN
ncbi:hypothetical protein [Mangrovibacillus cuniculi]|uniref:Peptidylprolyl isomerase n=1 Tax=Mangrovibacillus cuniculi TaxID=2593652 RepID=A0A7S8C904_9BACI|nr:hypothetical protein [Mangrovibacillus cuniculi]QPC45624.1 hypothetical protein G8O30_00840 [Mangrovibacillus cuniculi]